MPFDLSRWLQSHIPGGKLSLKGWYKVRCPYHRERSPSFAVHGKSGHFRCLAASCGQHGSLVKLLHDIEGISWREARDRLDIANPFGIPTDEEQAPVEQRSTTPWVNPFPPALVPVSAHRFPVYLQERGYGLDDALALGLHFGDDRAGSLRGYLVFPFWTLDGTYATFMARRMGDGPGLRYYRPENGIASRHLYGVHRLASAGSVERLFVVEGQFDVARIWQLGGHAVGLSTSRAESAQMNQIVALAQQFDCYVCVLLDQGAEEAAGKIQTALGGLGVCVYVGSLPVGVKDPDRLYPSGLPVEDARRLAVDRFTETLDICRGQELNWRQYSRKTIDTDVDRGDADAAAWVGSED